MKRLWVLLPLILLLLASCSFWGSSPSERLCSSELVELTLDESAFPDGWKKSTPQEDRNYAGNATDACAVTYYILNGVASQRIYLYSNEEDASEAFHRWTDVPGWSEEYLTAPLEIDQLDADEFATECGNRHSLICKIYVQYKKCVVVLTSYINPEMMTENEFQAVFSSANELFVDAGQCK